MIRQIIGLLNSNDWMVDDEDIAFAKGASKLPKTLKEALTTIKRNNGRRN
jgi:hypothetical protein